MPEPAFSYRDIAFWRYPVHSSRISGVQIAEFRVITISCLFQQLKKTANELNLLDSISSNGEQRAVDGGPAGSASGASLVSDPSDIRTSIGEDVDSGLQLLGHRKPVLKVVSHVLSILPFCPIKPNFI